MKPQELRIGNFINPEIGELEHVGQIKYIGYSGVGVELDCDEPELSLNHDLDLSDIKPIPLTEEWLEKFGFSRNLVSACCDYSLVLDHGYEHDLYYIYNHSEVDGSTSWIRTKGIRHVHELQNIYFSLTGYELELYQEEL